MGLDMYMYKIEKLNEAETLALVGVSTKDIPERYHYIDKETFDDAPDMYSDLIPFINEIPVIDTVFNHEACFSERNIDKQDAICGSFQAPDKICWFFESGAKIELNKSEYDKYLYEEETLIYVFKSTEIAYWRKNYELDDFLQNIRVIFRTKQYIKENERTPTNDEIACWMTENCGYYMLSAEEKRLLKDYLATNEDEDNCGHYHWQWADLLNDENSVIMYHAWW